MPSPVSVRSLSAPLPGTRLDSASLALLIPAAALVLASALLMAGGGDQWLADQLYRLQGSQWTLRDAWWTSHLLHKGGRNLTTFAAVLLVVSLVRAYVDNRWQPLRKPLFYLLLSVAISTGVVTLLKSWTQMDCPWDLQRYGGLRPFVGLLQPRAVMLGHAACFPAGHASAGYAWVALFFFMQQVRPHWRWHALAVALATGAAFGTAQQLRGAHFLSHDLTSLAISWAVATLLYLIFFGRLPATAALPRTRAFENGESA